MSRSTIGGVVGAVIGFVASGYNPQGAYWGWVIGSGVGALTDNTKTYGPRLQDAAQQSSQDGTPRTYGYGTFPTTGVILWRDKRKEIEEEQGKGGPSAVTYKYTWSYAIGVCLGPINNYLIVKRNGTIVYDTRSNEELEAVGYSQDEITKTRTAQGKWLTNAKLYKGQDGQLPDPTIQAVEGVDNTPAYPGYAYVVLTNEDVTNDGGAIPQYEFVISECGTSQEGDPLNPVYPGYLLVTGAPKADGAPVFAVALATEDLSFAGMDLSSGADVPLATGAYRDGKWVAISTDQVRCSTDNRVTFPSGTISAPNPLGNLVGGHDGFLVAPRDELGGGICSSPDGATFTPISVSALGTDGSDQSSDASNASYAWYEDGKYFLARGKIRRAVYYSENRDGPYVAAWDVDAEVLAGRDPNGAHIVNWHSMRKVGDFWYAVITWHFDTASRRQQIIRGPAFNNWTTFEVLVDTAWSAGTNRPAMLYRGDDDWGVCHASNGSIWTNANDWAEPISTGIGGPSWDGALNDEKSIEQKSRIAYVNKKFYIISTTDQAVVFDPEALTMSAPATLPVTFTVSIVAAGALELSGLFEVPDAPGSFVDRGGRVIAPEGNTTERCTPRLSGIVGRQTAKREITRIVTDELYETFVDGFRVATQTSPLANIQSLMSAYQFDGSEHDGKLWFLMRNQRELTFTITTDDLVEQSGDPFEWEITKENDLLRKVTVNYFDPLTNYSQTSQDWEMRSSTVKALGEGTFEMALTGTGNWAKRSAEMSGRIAWAERRETKLKVGLRHAARYTGEWGQFIDTKGLAHIVRITQINDEGITRELTLRKTRHSAYESLAEGVDSPLPTFPTGNVRGPTISVVMNMPVLNPDNDKAGVYWASTGLLTTWRGSKLSLSRTAGAWETGPSMDKSCTMGTLVSTLPSASRYSRDDTNTLTVKLFPYCPKTLASTDDEGILAEANAAALVYPSGKVELIQFKTSTLTAPNTYALTGLHRGLKDTTPGEHLADAMFVLLDTAVRFVAIRPDDVGKTLTFRAVSNGTDPDAADEDTLTFNTIESLREWQPYRVVESWGADGGLCLSWIGRARLGSSRAPVHSQWFDGYRVTITVGALEYSVDTMEQNICISAATMVDTFGADYAVPMITVRAKSKVVTGDDDFDSDPGTPTDPTANYPATIIGSPSDMYVGEPVFEPLGPSSGSPFQAYGGMWEETFTGEIVGNVAPRSSRPGEGAIFGVPLVAETRNAAAELVPSGPLVVGGPFTITDSVTVAAKPTYGMMDESLLSRGNALATAVTTPARTTKIVPPGGYGHIRSRAGFNTLKRRCVLTIDNLPAGGSIAVGVHAASFNATLWPGLAGQFAYTASTNGAYAIECDAVTGAITIKLAGVTVASGTLPLTHSYDGNYRFAWNVIGAAPGATVHCNMGNEAWPDTPTVGYVGVDNAPMVVPCGFDIAVATANGSRLRGELSMTEAIPPTADIANYAYAAFGRSTGKLRIGMAGGDANARLGFCKTGHTGRLGASGTADSIGFTDTRTPAGYIIETSFGGVHNRIVLPQFPYYSNPLVRFAFDIDAGTLEIWVKVEVTTGDPTAVYELLATLTGIPAGPWLPAISGQGRFVPEIAGPATYTNWTETF